MMRKIFALLFIIATSFGYSQQNEVPTFKKNEIKGNALFLIIGAAEITYERLLDPESGVGLTMFVSYDEYNFNMKFSATPYYRMYFGDKPAAGFFVQGFAMYNIFEETYSNCDDCYYDEYGMFYGNYYDEEEQSNNFALGIGVGGKWISKKGFLLELSAGIGRNIFSNAEYYPEIVGTGGVIIGYRF